MNIYACMQLTHTHTYTHIYTHAYPHTHMRTLTHARTYAHTDTHAHTRTHTYTNTHTHIHTNATCTALDMHTSYSTHSVASTTSYLLGLPTTWQSQDPLAPTPACRWPVRHGRALSSRARGKWDRFADPTHTSYNYTSCIESRYMRERSNNNHI